MYLVNLCCFCYLLFERIFFLCNFLLFMGDLVDLFIGYIAFLVDIFIDGGCFCLFFILLIFGSSSICLRDLDLCIMILSGLLILTYLGH